MYKEGGAAVSNGLEIDCAGVILAGGKNSRMGGENKAFLKVGGRSILERILATLTAIFDEILLVTRQPELYADIPARVVTDIYDARASLTGVHAGLVNARAAFAFVVPCDAPFVKPELIRLLLNEIEPPPASIDVVVPVNGGYYEPLCAVYSKRCLPHIEAQLERGDFRIFNFFGAVNVKTVSDERIRSVDETLQSFFNVNTPESLAAAVERLSTEEESRPAP